MGNFKSVKGTPGSAGKLGDKSLKVGTGGPNAKAPGPQISHLSKIVGNELKMPSNAIGGEFFP